MRFFTHQYISDLTLSDSDKSLGEDELIVKVTLGLQKFLSSRKHSKDKWIATCGAFIEMAHDFLEFVTAYRVADSIMIEVGYHTFLPVWQMSGQNKYKEICYSQDDTLYSDNPYSKLMEHGDNRCVKRYDIKNFTAHD